MQIRNPKHNASGGIDCEIEHPSFGWIPFTASPSDAEELGRQIYAAALAGDFGEIAPAPPAPPAPVPQVVTMRQARLALLGAGLLGGVDAAIAALPSPQKEAALIEWEYSSEVHRNRAFVQSLAGALSLTEQQLDALFLQAGAL